MPMPYDRDGWDDDPTYCDKCGNAAPRLTYRLANGTMSACIVCERCDLQEDEPEPDNEALALAEADALQKSFEQAMTARREYLHAIFRDHNCARCGHGERACVQGDPNRCIWPMARND